jgi:hypothetical protein
MNHGQIILDTPPTYPIVVNNPHSDGSLFSYGPGRSFGIDGAKNPWSGAPSPGWFIS